MISRSGRFLCVAWLMVNVSVSLGGLMDWRFGDSEVQDSAENGPKIVCYYTNWAQYRPKPGTYLPADIDPNLCTHLIIAFAKINAAYELETFEWNDESTEWSEGTYQKIVNLKKINKNLKVLVAVGGWNHGSRPFSDMVSSDDKRANFVNQTVNFLLRHKLDGLDLDWEYPANRDTENRPDDKFYFTILCKELYTEFRPRNLILTAAVAAGEKYINTAYEISEIHKYLNFINIMAYDLHGAWENVTGHNAPLYKHSFDKDQTLNVDFALKSWLEGVPPEKLVLGLATYGRSFRIKEGFESCPLVDTPISQAGTSGTYSRENGFLTYYEVCEKLLTENWKYVWNEEQQVPYAYSNEITSQGMPIEWVGFDDVRSIEAKVKYIKEKNLAGAMIWSLDMDDFTGSFCKQGKYPLLRTINYHLNKRKKVDLPEEHIIRKKLDSKEPPVYESDFFKDYLDKKLSTSFNVFTLIQNDIIQIYRFCQCKNGTHKISASQNNDDKPDDRYTYVVDCNRKEVHSSSNFVKIKQDNDKNTDTRINNNYNNNNKVDDNKDVHNVWTVFGSSSAVQTSPVPQSYIYVDEFDENRPFKLVCYISNFHERKHKNASFRIDSLDGNLCTHLVYSMAKIDELTYETLVPLQNSDPEFYEKLNELKKSNPNLKVLISFGSYRDGTTPLLKMLNNAKRRREFIRNTILFFRKYGFDGLEFNWNIRSVDFFHYEHSTEMIKFLMTNFLKQLHFAFKPFNFILAARVSGRNDVADESYEINEIDKYVDFVTVTMFDFYETPLKLKHAYHHSPLFNLNMSPMKAAAIERPQSVDESVKYWLINGLSRHKLIVGLDLYARTYTLHKNGSLNVIGSTVNREGAAGKYTQMPGILSHFETCEYLMTQPQTWIQKQLNNEKVPVMYNIMEHQIVFYEDTNSVEAKSIYVKRKNLAGLGMFSLDMDDASGHFCMDGAYPLVRKAKQTLNSKFYLTIV